jgi:valyl-tRNA synthetase
MGWPDTDSADFKRYFPTNTLVTGYDIIFFWVSRMIFQSLEFTDRRPFKNVLMHGLIRDEQGRKMSKSLGNGIDPMEVIEKYGADALRWFLSNGSAPGQDVRFSYEKMDAAWNFINKIWNASRFVLMNCEGMTAAELQINGEKSVADRWILARLNETVAKVTDLFDRFEFGEAGRQLYNFIWDDFCDWYIEMSKETLYGENEAAKQTNKAVLVYVLDQSLRLLHPIMPFVTEEIWSKLPYEGTSLVVASYPVVEASFEDEKAIVGMGVLKELIRSVRNIRAEVNTPLSKPITLLIQTNDSAIEAFLQQNTNYIERFCNPEELVIAPDLQAPELAMSAVLTGATIYLPLAGLINIEEEISRLEKELAKWQQEVKRVQGKLANERFVANAPADVVEQERAKEADYLAKETAVKERIAQLKTI